MLHPYSVVHPLPSGTPEEEARWARIDEENRRHAETAALIEQQRQREAERSADTSYADMRSRQQAEKERLEAERYNARKEWDVRVQAEKAEAAKRLAALSVEQRAAAIASERKLDMSMPTDTGSGWAGAAFALTLRRAQTAAQQLLEAVAIQTMAVDRAREQLGEQLIAIQELTAEREALDLCEARFDIVYRRFDSLRRKLSDSAFRAELDKASALMDGGATHHWLTADLPERAELERGVAIIMRAIESLTAQHQQRSEQRTQFLGLVRKLELATDTLGESQYHHLDIGGVERWTAGVIGSAAKELYAQQGGKPALALDWFPTRDRGAVRWPPPGVTVGIARGG
jgi:hypothetical protein